MSSGLKLIHHFESPDFDPLVSMDQLTHLFVEIVLVIDDVASRSYRHIDITK